MTSHPISVHSVRTLKENVMALLCRWPKVLLCHATGKISRLSLLLLILTFRLEILGIGTGSMVLGVGTSLTALMCELQLLKYLVPSAVPLSSEAGTRGQAHAAACT